MGYKGPSLDSFDAYQGKDGSYSNNQDNLFKLFPFTSHGPCPEVHPGCFIRIASGCEIEKEQTLETRFDEVVSLISGSLYGDSEELTIEVLREIATYSDTNNLRIALSAENSNNANKTALYLASMAGDTKTLRDMSRAALNRSNDDANVVERLIYRVVPIKESSKKESRLYSRVSSALSPVFLDDLKFVLSDSRLTEMHLASLLSFYFFMTVSQNCLAVSKKMNGTRKSLEELYFAMDSEKTNQTRACYKRGFKKLESALEEMFVHAGVLEILNTVDGHNDDVVDYISIRELVAESPECELEIAENIRLVTERIRTFKYDADLFSNSSVRGLPATSAKEEVDLLYDTVKMILFNTSRNGSRGKYSNSFRLFARSGMCFEKSRGRGGTLLNISDTTLLLLTTLAIGEKDSISLTDLFKQFCRRGVCLDESSKEHIASYFEKRSMLDKKSDSGETQYVKRVL